MMDNIYFVVDNEIIYPADYGLILKAFDVADPEPKIYRYSIDGRDGDLDMTDWAGETKYNNRAVSAQFRGMEDSKWSDFANLINGKMCKIFHSSSRDYYYNGRCSSVNHVVSQHVTDGELQFTCDPYRMAIVDSSVYVASTNSAQISLSVMRKTVVPIINCSAACTLTDGSKTYNLSSGNNTIADFMIMRQPKTVTITGTANVTFTWKDGIL